MCWASTKMCTPLSKSLPWLAQLNALPNPLAKAHLLLVKNYSTHIPQFSTTLEVPKTTSLTVPSCPWTYLIWSTGLPSPKPPSNPPPLFSLWAAKFVSGYVPVVLMEFKCGNGPLPCALAVNRSQRPSTMQLLAQMSAWWDVFISLLLLWLHGYAVLRPPLTIAYLEWAPWPASPFTLATHEVAATEQDPIECHKFISGMTSTQWWIIYKTKSHWMNWNFTG